MLNVYNLSRVMTEAASGSYVDLASIEPYEFIGSMDEATQEFNHLVMAECVEMNQFNANSQEIIIEAAMSNPDRLNILSESVFEKVKNGIAAFFDRLIKFVKGIIEKLKAFFLKLTGKTDKWYEFMKPKIEEAKRRGGYTDVTAEMHKWNVDVVTSGLKNAVVKAMDELKSDEGAKTADSIANNYKKSVNTLVKNSANSAKDEDGKKYADADSESVNSAVDSIDKIVESIKKEAEDAKADFPKKVADILSGAGISNLATASMDDLWKSLRKEVSGGEKTTVKYVQEIGIEKMMESIKKSTETINDLKKAYDAHLKFLGDTKATIVRKIESISIPQQKTIPTELNSSLQSVISAYSNLVTSKYSSYEAAINNIRGENVKAVQDMNSEFMGVLNKFANIKSKKD